MNNKGEIYRALNAGEKIHSDRYGEGFLHLVEDVLINHLGKIRDHDFKNPSDWSIYKEPKWYENIPDGGVLCTNEYGYVFIVKEYKEDGRHPYKCIKSIEPEETPLTKQEIQVFMDNAPVKSC